MDSKQETEGERRSGFYNLLVWQKSMTFTKAVYQIAHALPKEEQFALANQLRRSAVSIPSNIAEGSKRGRKEFAQFLRIASASAAEAETQLLLVKELYSLPIDDALAILIEVERMLESLIKKVRP